MTDALQQRSRYQCALKNAPLGEFLLFAVFKLRRLKLSVISIRSTRKDLSMVIELESYRRYIQQKTRIKIPVSSISIIPLILSICP